MLVAVKRSMFNVYILILMNWTFMTIIVDSLNPLNFGN